MAAPLDNKNAVGNKGGGAPSKYLPKYAKMAYKMALLGATDEELADLFEVSERTINTWKTEHVEFSSALKKGKSIADANVANRLYQRAMGYQHEDVDIRVVDHQIVLTPLTKHYPPDTTAAIFWLKNRQSKKWRDKVEHGLTDKEGDDVPPVIVFRLPDNGRST